MSKEAMKGIDFEVAGTISTGNSAYVILVDDAFTSYFPVQCTSFISEMVATILGEKTEFEISQYGLYFSFLAMLKAHDIEATQIVLTISRQGKITCYMDVVEDVADLAKISRVPFTVNDAIILSLLGNIPLVLYGPAGTDFVFKIDKSIPKQNVFNFICEEIARSEKMSAIQEEGDQE